MEPTLGLGLAGPGVSGRAGSGMVMLLHIWRPETATAAATPQARRPTARMKKPAAGNGRPGGDVIIRRAPRLPQRGRPIASRVTKARSAAIGGALGSFLRAELLAV